MIDRELYIAVMAFLTQSGGTYRNLDSATCRDIIDAMAENRIRIMLHASTGEITAVTTWWMINEADIDLVKNGGRPKDVNAGTIVYIADHAGQGAYPGLVKYLRDTVGEIDSCWHHRYKHPGQFRYRHRKEDRNV